MLGRDSDSSEEMLYSEPINHIAMYSRWVMHFIAALIFSSNLYAQQSAYHISYTPEIQRAYADILRLDYQAFESRIEEIAAQDPKNIARLHIEQYRDFYIGIIDGGKNVVEMAKNTKQRLKEIDQAPNSSPYKLWMQAELRLQYAVVLAKQGKQLKAGWSINKAYKQLRQNQELFPNFALNDKSLSVIHAVVGSIQGLNRTLMRVFTSLRGSHAEGIASIEKLYEQRNSPSISPFGVEILVIRAMMALHVEKNEESALRIIQSDLSQYASSPLIAFITASMLLQCNAYDNALVRLERAVADGHGESIPYLHHMLGVLYVERQSQQGASHLKRYIATTKDENYIKEAYQKLAWSALILDSDTSAYHTYIDSCGTIGLQSMGADQDAYLESLRKEVPDIHLLKARLYYDGGLYEEALSSLTGISTPTSEWYYRKARIHQATEQLDSALHNFDHVIKDQQAELYPKCNAALQSAILFYKKGDEISARQMLHKCLSTHPKQHKNGLHQKAKSWLQKIEG